MSETGMAMASPMAGAKEAVNPLSYVSLYDGAPDSYPEVAREITMLLGQAEVVHGRVRHAEESFGLLRDHIRPITDQRPKPNPGSLTSLSEVATGGVPEVASPVANDLRRIGAALRAIEDALDALRGRIDNLNADVML